MFKAYTFDTNKKEIIIGVIGDTHIYKNGTVSEKALKTFRDNRIDLIIHSGDIVSFLGLKDLEKIAPVYAVQGNNDLPEIEEKYPTILLLKIFNWKIGVLHSLTSFFGSFFGKESGKVKELNKQYNFDIIISGHSHRPYVKKIKDSNKEIILINPGSSNQPFLSWSSVVILKISKNSYDAKIIFLKKIL